MKNDDLERVISYLEYTAALVTGLVDNTLVEVAIVAHLFKLNIAVQYTHHALVGFNSYTEHKYNDNILYFKGHENP